MKTMVQICLVMVLSALTLCFGDNWLSNVEEEACHFVSTGDNPYFSLKPGTVRVYKAKHELLVITVLPETRFVDGVETRIVEEKESRDGVLTEVSRNYYAMCRETGTVYYFGEDVDMYKDGKVIGHGGSWLSGVNGAKYGIMMPGKPKKGMKYYQEQCPGVAMDRAEVAALHETLHAGGRTFKNCLKTVETSPLEPGSKGYKYYAAGIGLVKDNEFVLVADRSGGKVKK